MAGATLHIVQSPRRVLNKTEAARYCGVPAKQFVLLGIAPLDLPGGGSGYDLHDLDKKIDELKFGAADPDDSVLALLG